MKIAIVGFGFMGEMHAQVYQDLPDIELSAVVDINTPHAKKKLSLLGIDVPVYATLHDLLVDCKVQAIDICSPTGQHIELAIEAAEAGKHLFIEKPLAFDLIGCRQIETAIRKAGVMAQVGHCIRFWPEYMALSRTIKHGKMGNLKSLALSRRSPRPAHGDPEHWVNKEKLSGGAAFDLHVHETDFILHLFGLPKSVHSSIARGMSGPDHIFTHYGYEKITVHAEGGWNYPKHYTFNMGFEAIFEKGAVIYQSNNQKPLMCILEGKRSKEIRIEQAGPQKSKIKTGNLSQLSGYYNELEYFTHCLKTNTPPEIATISQAINTIQVLRAEIDSAKSSRTITI